MQPNEYPSTDNNNSKRQLPQHGAPASSSANLFDMVRGYPDPATHTGFTPPLKENPGGCINPQLLQQTAPGISDAEWDAMFSARDFVNSAISDPTSVDHPNQIVQLSAAPATIHARDESGGSDLNLVPSRNNGAIGTDPDLNLDQNMARTRASDLAAAASSNGTERSVTNGMNHNMNGPGMTGSNDFDENDELPYYSQAPYFNLPPQHTEPPPLYLQSNFSFAGASRYVPQHQGTYAAQGLDPSMFARNPPHLEHQQSGQGPPVFGHPDWSGSRAQAVDQHQPDLRRRDEQISGISPKTIPEGTPTLSLKRRMRDTQDTTPQPDTSRTKRECHDCPKSFFASKDPWFHRCTRCYQKFVKNNAEATVYNYDPSITIQDAWATLYPTLEAATIPRDDVAQESQRGQHYMRRLVEAVTQPYTDNGSNTKDSSQRLAQQAKMNKKPYDSVQYTQDLVNKRLHLLYQTAVSYHAGGQVYYDIGGDNSGYGEDKALVFSERLDKIITLLRTNKDIAMDVIEGRGVTALVLNPNKYERRKRDNKKSNDTKQDLQDKGKVLERLEREGTVSKAGKSVPPSEGHARDSVEGWDEGEMEFDQGMRGGEGFHGLSEQPDGDLEGYIPAWR